MSDKLTFAARSKNVSFAERMHVERVRKYSKGQVQEFTKNGEALAIMLAAINYCVFDFEI